MSGNKGGTEIAQKPHPLSAFFNKYFSCRKTMIFQDIFVWKLVPKNARFSKQEKEGNIECFFLVCFFSPKNLPNPNISAIDYTKNRLLTEFLHRMASEPDIYF